MARYKVTNFPTAFKLLTPTTTMVKGVAKKVYPDPEDVPEVLYGLFRTYGGTENMSNDVYTVFDTGVFDTWYRPDITTDCKIYICKTGEIYDVNSRPEDIDMRGQFLQFKVKKVGGKP